MANHWEVLAAGHIRVSNRAEDIWDNAIQYFKWCDNNPIETKKTILIGKAAGTEGKSTLIRPYNVRALCLHCGILEEYLKDILSNKDKSSLYYIVISRIMYLIYVQNVELATVGVFSPIFTARILNLDKDETPNKAITVNIVGGLSPLSMSESEVLEKLDIENGSIIKREI